MVEQLVASHGVVYLVIAERVVTAVTLYLCAYERLFVEVFALVFVFIHPQLGEHLRYLRWHQAAEDGVARILCGGG